MLSVVYYEVCEINSPSKPIESLDHPSVLPGLTKKIPSGDIEDSRQEFAKPLPTPLVTTIQQWLIRSVSRLIGQRRRQRQRQHRLGRDMSISEASEHTLSTSSVGKESSGGTMS